MVRQTAPQFFTIDIPATLAYYKGKLGFECLGTWQDPPVYAIVARDQHIDFSHYRPTTLARRIEREPVAAEPAREAEAGTRRGAHRLTWTSAS